MLPGLRGLISLQYRRLVNELSLFKIVKLWKCSWLLPHEQAICFGSLIWLSRNKSVQKSRFSRIFTSRSRSRSILISLFTSRKRVKAFLFHFALLEKEWKHFFFHFALLEKEWKLFYFTFHFLNFKNPLSLVPVLQPSQPLGATRELHGQQYGTSWHILGTTLRQFWNNYGTTCWLPSLLLAGQHIAIFEKRPLPFVLYINGSEFSPGVCWEAVKFLPQGCPQVDDQWATQPLSNRLCYSRACCSKACRSNSPSGKLTCLVLFSLTTMLYQF